MRSTKNRLAIDALDMPSIVHSSTRQCRVKSRVRRVREMLHCTRTRPCYPFVTLQSWTMILAHGHYASVCGPLLNAMKAYIQIHIFLTSALAGCEWSASSPGRFTPGERVPGTRWIARWADPTAGLDDMEKWKFLTLPGLGTPSHFLFILSLFCLHLEVIIASYYEHSRQLPVSNAYANRYCILKLSEK
jgi:hypothetical protein